MSYTPFKEVTVSNPGSSTRYGSDDLLDVMKILNAKVVSTRRPEITNPWRWSSWQEIKQVAEASVTTPSDSDVAHLFLSATDNKLKVKKTGGTIINLEDIGTGTWSNTGGETIINKTMNVDQNTFKHSTSNFAGDLLKHNGTKFDRFAKGTANQVLAVNAAGTDLEWQVQTGGGGGSGESNTASNTGTAGIGVFYQKLGFDLEFKSLFSPDSSINISDDTGNQKIDFTLGSAVVKSNQANSFGDFNQSFKNARLNIANPAGNFAYFFNAAAITASRNIFLPLLQANDTITFDNFTSTLINKTLGTGTVANLDVINLKHSITNIAGDLVKNTGTKYDRFPRGAGGQFLKVNATGTDIEWGSVPTPAATLNDLTDVAILNPVFNQILKYDGTQWVNEIPAAGSAAGVKLPDGTIAPTTGRWGAFFGGAGNGFGMMACAHSYARLHGSSGSLSESFTDIYTAPSTGAVAEFKTGCGFRRDSTCVFKAKWKIVTATACKVKIGLSSGIALPAGGGGTGGGVTTTRYDVTQSSADHFELAAGLTRLGVRFNAGAPGLGEAVTEVLVRFRKYGSPSGSATVGVRKNSDGTLVSLGTFTPNSFGSGEQVATISAPSNVYPLAANDRVTVEFPGNDSNGIELDEDDSGQPSGFQSQEYNGSAWANTSEALGLRIRTTTLPAGPGVDGDLPLAGNVSGIMVHGTIGTHTNYRIARNNGAATQTEEDSTKPLANSSTHTLEININTTNCVLTLDGTAFTYTTTVPGLTTDMAWYMHIESAAAAEKGLSVAYAQVVTIG